MPQKDQVQTLLRDKLTQTLNEMGSEIPEITAETRLFGSKGLLDSIGLVSYLADLEEKLEDEFGVSLILADERAMSREKSPFRSLGTLTDYVDELLAEQQKGA